MVTTSDVVPLRLQAAPGVPSAAHGTYRARSGTGVSVLTTTQLPALDGGQHYVGWIRRGDRWTALGSVEVRASDDRSLTVAELGEDAGEPDELRVTRESNRSSTPGDAVVLEWSRPRVP